MWKKITTGRNIFLCFVVALLFFLPAICMAQEQQQEQKMVQVPMQDLVELKSLLSQQKTKLAELQSTLTEPQAKSAELLSQVEKLNSQLLASQKELIEAQKSLASAKTLMSEQNKSLTDLSAAIKKERAKNKLQNIRNTGYGFLAGLATGYMVHKYC